MSLLTMHGISKIYQAGDIQVPALKNINLGIDENLFISFIGPSGSGKTTLLNLIGCLDKPTEGEVFINGENVNRLMRKEAAKFLSFLKKDWKPIQKTNFILSGRLLFIIKISGRKMRQSAGMSGCLNLIRKTPRQKMN